MLISESPRIGYIDENHEFLRDNVFILSGYRLYFSSTFLLLKSMFKVHNESVNIWSHGVALILFLVLLLYCVIITTSGLPFVIEEALREIWNTTIRSDDIERWPIFVFLSAAIVCFFFSTLYHTFNAHSRSLRAVLVRLDYGGISFLIAGSYFPFVYYIFFCQKILQYVYLGGISFLCSVSFIVALLPFFHKPRFIKFRGIIFLATGLFGIIPFFHSLFIPDIDKFGWPFFFYALMGSLYVTGNLIYISRFPECRCPGKYDYCGNSHNIWHFFVVCAAVSHYVASIESYLVRQDLIC